MIEAYIIVWNREDTIPLTIKHYQKFCSKITVCDNFSTDKTREVAIELGAEVKLFGISGVLDDGEYKHLKNNCWKGSKADWVIIVDDDEILYHENIKDFLDKEKQHGTTIVRTQGFSVHSNSMPRNDWLELQDGMIDDNYSKLCIFNPQQIKDIGYEFGCHTHMKDHPKGRLVLSNHKLFLLHYRSVGGVNRLLKRWAEYEPRRQKSVINMRWNLGFQYSQEESAIRKEWKESLEKSLPLSKVGLV